MSAEILHTRTTSLITFREGLPLEGECYIPEIQGILERGIIERYGEEEFESIILTHEFHGHIGIFTVIGTKMGLHARELLGAPKKAMKVLSECGKSRLPVRCINDGLIISTGCTPHFGTMYIDETKDQCAAMFLYKGRSLRLCLSDPYKVKLEEDIDMLVSRFKVNGILTPPYWKEVQKLARMAWEEWDRKAVFDITWTDNAIPADPDKSSIRE